MSESQSLLEAFRSELNLADDQVRQLQTSYFAEGLPLLDAF